MKKYAIVKPLDLIPYKPNQHWIYHPKYLQLGLQNNPNRIWRSQIHHNTGIDSFSRDPPWFLMGKMNKTFYQTDKKTCSIQVSKSPDFDCRIIIEMMLVLHRFEKIQVFTYTTSIVDWGIIVKPSMELVDRNTNTWKNNMHRRTTHMLLFNQIWIVHINKIII